MIISPKRTGVVLAAVVTVLVAVTTTVAQDANDTIVVRGATTVAQLINPWVRDFQDSDKQASVVVFGSSHGDGVEQLAQRKAQVAMLAKKLSPEDEAGLEKAGIKFAQEFLCHDAVGVVVHRENPLNGLSLDQLRKIFSGEFTNWREVGGADQTIEVVDLPPDSGMRTFLAKTALGVPFLANPAAMTSPNRVPEEVGRRTGAIGYCRTQLALSPEKAEKLKPLAIRKDGASEAVPLTQETILQGTFPLMRSLWLCYDESAPSSTKNFVEYCAKKVTQQVAGVKKASETGVR